MDAKEILQGVHTILVVDWPTKEVPEGLTLSGFHVWVQGGHRPEDYYVYEVSDGQVVSRHAGRPPERADLIYSYRPLKELRKIIATAKSLRAKTIWTQSGLTAAGEKDPKGCWLAEDERSSAQSLVEAAGLNYITEPFIGDVARLVADSRK